MNHPDKPEDEAPSAPVSRNPDTTIDWRDPDQWPEEIGGVRGPEPTRYGDWERNGRCSDF